MVKHCTRCNRRWSVSALDKQTYYICPECEQQEKERDKKARESVKNITKIYMGGGRHGRHENDNSNSGSGEHIANGSSADPKRSGKRRGSL